MGQPVERPEESASQKLKANMRIVPKPTTRREFLKDSTIVTVGTGLGLKAISSPAVLGNSAPSKRVRVGFIGLGNRGSQLLQGFLAQPDCEVAALCDVYEPYLYRRTGDVDPEILKSLGERYVPRMTEDLNGAIPRYKDFRQLLERKDIDAVVISTPDHWHAIQTIQAFEAGKDVYVEKPLTMTIVEGRKMVEAQKRTQRIAQVGLHRRSSRLYRRLHELVQEGKFGKITTARAYRISNMFPKGIGRYADAKPPKGLDWDTWIGPRAMRPFRYNIAPYKFRWWQDYSSQMGNWGVHYCDAVRWVLDERAPIAVSAHGGNFALEDDRTIPDTMEVTFEFASGRLLVFGQYEAGGGPALPTGEIEFRGTLASLYPEPEGRGCKVVVSRGGQFQDDPSSLEPDAIPRMDENLTHQHIRNFLDAIQSGTPCNCDLETGHRSTTFAHLANIAMARGSRIEWDCDHERVTNDSGANELLHYDYRSPWSLG